MKILLDECVPTAFRHSFSALEVPGLEVHSVEWAGFKGMTNGTLLRAAEEGGYDLLLTTDQGIPHQQSPANRHISILVICAATNKLDDLVPLLPNVQAELTKLQSGSVIFVR